jgi:hypothetical protein
LYEVASHVGQIVLFEGHVDASYKTRSGTYFIKFQHGHVRSVFKLVIFREYAQNFTAGGVRIEDYARRRVRVRGLLQNHRRWGLEIVLRDPSDITVIG